MGSERREYKRFSSSVIARVRILIPEETFSPFIHEAMIMDISERGMKVRTHDLDEATYRMLLSSTRMVRVTFTPPDTEIAHTLFGKIVWIDFNNLSQPPDTNYGISFEELDEEDKKVVAICLKALSVSTKV